MFHRFFLFPSLKKKSQCQTIEMEINMDHSRSDSNISDLEYCCSCSRRNCSRQSLGTRIFASLPLIDFTCKSKIKHARY